MTDYICTKCKKKFKKKYDYNRHTKRLTSCVGGSKTEKKPQYQCKGCKKSLSRKDALTRHMLKCKYIKSITKTKIKGNNNANVNGIKNNTKVINNPVKIDTKIDTIKIDTIKNMGPIYIINFGKDGIKNLTGEEYKNIFATEKNLIQYLMEIVNLNKNKPQHHNVCYSDLKSAYGEFYQDKEWIKDKIDSILDTLIDAKMEDLNEILNDMKDFLNKKTRNKIRETIEHFDYSKPDHRKKLKTFLKPILYNNKNMILKKE